MAWHLSSALAGDCLVVHLISYDGYDFVMPALAGIQAHTVQTCGESSRIPGLAVLTRNDASLPRKIIETKY